MVGPMGKTAPCAPDRGGKHHNRKQEEDASDFKPKNATDPAERAQKTAHPPCHIPGRPSCSPASRSYIRAAGAGAG